MIRTKIFGCKTNKFYAEKWLASGELDGLHGIFVVSCVVTDQAKSRWVKYVTKQAQELKNSNEKIYLSGCGSLDGGKLDPKFWEKYPQLQQYQGCIVLLGQEPHTVAGKEVLRSNGVFRTKLETLKKKQQLYTRKHIVIQTGCDTFCTFCATIHARGRHKNRHKDDIIGEIKEFENNGGKEVVITGINLGAWGADSTLDIRGSRFPELLEAILSETSIPRIRISSTGVEFVSDRVIELYKETRINPHIHLSIQSGSTEILKKMNRKYDREELLSVMVKLRGLKRNDGVSLSVGADMIVGFPGETQQDHEQSLEIIREYGVHKLHAFPFSAHVSAHSVPAARLKGQVDQNTKYERLREMIGVGDDIRKSYVEKNIGQELEVLIEKTDGVRFSGWTQNYIAVSETNFDTRDATLAKNTIVKGVLTAGEEKDAHEKNPPII